MRTKSQFRLNDWEQFWWVRLADRLLSLSTMQLVFIYVGAIAVAAYFSEGWIQPDEHTRVFEPAHFIAYGYAGLPWEFTNQEPIVSFLLGALHAPILSITRMFDLDGTTEAFFLRFGAGLFLGLRIPLMYLILGEFGFSTRFRRALTLFFAISVFGLLLIVRTSQEGYATTLSMIAGYYALKSFRGIGSQGWNGLEAVAKESISGLRIFIVFCSLGLASSIRYQFSLTAIFLSVFLLWRMRVNQWWLVGIATALSLIPLAVVDYVTVGKPFWPAWNYLLYATNNDAIATVWGSEPWYWYFKEYFVTWFPPYSPFLLLLFIPVIFKRPFLFVLTVPHLVLHCYLSHKEMRYMHPILPWIFIATAIGLSNGIEKTQWLRNFVLSKFGIRCVSVSLGISSFAGIVGAVLTLNSAPRVFAEVGRKAKTGELEEGVVFAGNTMNPIPQFYIKAPNLKVIQYDMDSYFENLDAGEIMPHVLILYAAQHDEFQRVSKMCQLIYPGKNIWEGGFVHSLYTSLRRTRHHGIFYCPDVR